MQEPPNNEAELSTEEEKQPEQPALALIEMSFKNCVKNDTGVVKEWAVETYDEQFSLSVSQKKMTEERKQELLAKIEKVASNDVSVNAGTDYDLKVSKEDQDGSIIIDLVAHIIKSDENEPDKMNVSYASAYCKITNATADSQAKACQLVHKVIKNSLSGMGLKEQERATIEQSLTELGEQSMVSVLQQD